MEIQAKKLNGANALAGATISADVIKANEDKILKVIARDAKVDGFRKGKVPTSVLAKMYGEKVKNDAEQEAVHELYALAIKELGLDEKNIVGEPLFTKFERNESGLDVELKISFKPDIKLDGYEACIPSFEMPKVAKKEVDERVEQLAAQSAPLKAITTKRAAKMGDFVVIDFEGFVDGAPFEGGKAENYTLELGSKSFIEGFEEGVVGMKAGGEKDIDVTFPSGYGNRELSGKPAVFKVKLTEIQEKNASGEISEEMLKRFLPNEAEPTQEKFKERVEVQLKNEKLSKLYHEELKPQFVEEIIKKFKFDLPENIIEQEIDVQFRNDIVNIKPEELDEYKNDPKKAQAKRESYRGAAEDSVRLTFIVNELALANNITVTDQEVMQMIYFEALQYGQEPKAHFENYKNQGVLPAVKMAMIEDRLFQTLFDRAAKLDEKPAKAEKAEKAAKPAKEKAEKAEKTEKKEKKEPAKKGK